MGPANAVPTALASRTRGTGTLLLPAAIVVVAAVAFAARIGLLLRGGGLLNIGAYDDGVYYAAAGQLLHGHLPYRDYVFVQPPLIVVVLTPFAALAHLVGDPAALVTMRLAFELLGALNAVLVLLVLRRFGWTAALPGALLYAVFYPAAYDERTALLEPLGTTGLLVALLALARIQDAGGTRGRFLTAGIALGVAVDFKIWYLVPVVVVLAFARGGRLRLLLGAAAAIVVAYLPFFLASPVRSFTQIVLDQLGRGRSAPGISGRMKAILGVNGTGPYSVLPHVSPTAALVVATMLLAVAVVLVALDRRARVHVALLLTGGAVLLAAPSFFEHYVSLVAPPLALVVGCAAGRVLRGLRNRRWRAAALAAVLLLVLGLNVRHDLQGSDRRVPVEALQAAARPLPGCIYSDEPTLLAVMDVLTRDLDRGCAVQPDMSGISFDPAGRPSGVRHVQRPKNPVYQQEVLSYLTSGTAFIAVRKGAEISTATKRELARHPALVAEGPYVLRRVR